MPTVFDTLKSHSFGGIEFPITSCKVSGAIRDKVHEYPHSPGGASEKLGRKLYEVRISSDFLAGAIVQKHANLWPGKLTTLRGWFEQQLTKDLHVPTIGTFPAYCVNWEEESKNTRRNGVSAEFLFREDQDQAELVNKLIDLGSAGLEPAIANFEIAIAQRPDSTDLFDGILAVANGVLAIKDQVDLYGSLVAAKITTLALLCDQADRQILELDTLEFQNVRDALHDLWLSARKLEQDAQQKLVRLKTYTTPITMPLTAIARAVGVLNPGDILQLNAIGDVLQVPSGSTIRYYEPAA